MFPTHLNRTIAIDDVRRVYEDDIASCGDLRVAVYH